MRRVEVRFIHVFIHHLFIPQKHTGFQRMVGGGGRRENVELSFNGYRVSVLWKRVLGMDSGNGYTITHRINTTELCTRNRLRL